MADLFGRNDFDPKAFIKKLDALEREIPDEVSPFDAKDRLGKEVLERIHYVVGRLTVLARTLDPVEHSELLDPTRPEVVAEVFTGHLLKRDRAQLQDIKRGFHGSGVYALYYSGDHPAYKHISGRELPIYVGKADPQNPDAKTSLEQGTKLHDRLVKDHLRSIRIAQEYATGNRQLAREGIRPIRAEDFLARWIALPSAYAAAVEQVLINTYQPPWNMVAFGFGKHGDASSTRKNKRSEWDTIHPGRKWAMTPETIPNDLTAREIQERILELTEPKD
jgi:hypothetical protein